MSQYVLHDRTLAYGSYGNNCNVMTRINIGRNLLSYDCILCNRNATRKLINEIFRSDILKFTKFGSNDPLLRIGDKLVCKQNNWNMCIDGIYLTNGTTGFVEYINEEKTNGNKITVDFKPDFISGSECFYEVPINRRYLEDSTISTFSRGMLNFDYAYALTVHSAQGSQFNRLLYIDDGFSGDRDIKKKLKYTAITRAVESIDIVDSGCFYSYKPINV
jgi:exodeoxyribonuclease-5